MPSIHLDRNHLISIRIFFSTKDVLLSIHLDRDHFISIRNDFSTMDIWCIQSILTVIIFSVSGTSYLQMMSRVFNPSWQRTFFLYQELLFFKGHLVPFIHLDRNHLISIRNCFSTKDILCLLFILTEII